MLSLREIFYAMEREMKFAYTFPETGHYLIDGDPFFFKKGNTLVLSYKPKSIKKIEAKKEAKIKINYVSEEEEGE